MLINIFFVLMLTSCSFNSSDSRDKKEVLTQGLGSKFDSDGDFIYDIEESKYGFSKNIANLPKLQVLFKQNYSFKVSLKDLENISINNYFNLEDQGYKRDLGSILIEELSLNRASGLSHSSHYSQADLIDSQLEFFKYPRFSEYRSQINRERNLKLLKNKEITNISLKLSASFKLDGFNFFNEVKDIKISFYYFSHSKEKFIKVHTEALNLSFMDGVKEGLSLELNNLPVEFLLDSYLSRGEFLVIDIEDYFIPRHNITYKQLKTSVKEKCVQVFVRTPSSTSLKHIALNEGNNSFVDILSKIYPKQFTISDNKITHIDQYSDNLQAYSKLIEIREEGKKGKWFVLTNKFEDHYADHNYNNQDFISLTYFTGHELATTVNNEKTSSYSNIHSGDNFIEVDITGISKNSDLDLLVKPNSFYGVQLEVEEKVFNYIPPNCRNCTGNDWSVTAKYSINSFIDYSKPSMELSLEDLWRFYEFRLNNTAIDIEKLYKENKLFIEEIDSTSKYLRISFKDLGNIDGFIDNGENRLFLKLKAQNVQSTGVGVQVNSVSGRNIDILFQIANVGSHLATQYELPLSVTSSRFSEFEPHMNWGARHPNGYIFTKGHRKKSFDAINVDIYSTVTNYNN